MLNQESLLMNFAHVWFHKNEYLLLELQILTDLILLLLIATNNCVMSSTNWLVYGLAVACPASVENNDSILRDSVKIDIAQQSGIIHHQSSTDIG